MQDLSEGLQAPHGVDRESFSTSMEKPAAVDEAHDGLVPLMLWFNGLWLEAYGLEEHSSRQRQESRLPWQYRKPAGQVDAFV